MRTKKNQTKTSILFIVPAILGVSPGQRFRFEHYLPLLSEYGIKYEVKPYYSKEGRKKLYTNSNLAAKALTLLTGYIKRMSVLFTVWRFEYVYIHREDAPIGPPVFSWFASKVFRRKLIYDFDDAIWIPVMSDYNRRFSFVKFFGNVAKICKWAHTVSVGNEYLKKFAEQHNKNVVVIPTVVNTETVHSRIQIQDVDRPALGWTGSFSTLQYLNMVVPVIQLLQDEIDFTFYVIADRDPKLPLKKYEFIKWNAESETDDLLRFHVGIMPLTDDVYSRGKCGFKAIQYMSLGMPAIVSPVGVNTLIVDNDSNGFICNNEEEWKSRIRQLLTDSSMRQKMGRLAREKIENNYSVKSTHKLFLNLFINQHRQTQIEA